MIYTLLISVCGAVLFYRAASYERMNPLVWSLASLGLTAVISLRSPGISLLLLAQASLFMGMWGYNIRRHNRKNPPLRKEPDDEARS